MKYRVSQTFSIFGDPCERIFDTIEDARDYGKELAEGIAEDYGWYGERVGNYMVSRVNDQQSSGTGLSNEVEFAENIKWEFLPEEDAVIRVKIDDLVADIENRAIKIEEVN